MNRAPPLVSVVVPYYSHGRHLHQAVHSALRAYRGPIEIVIVNDGSPEPKARIYLNNAKAISSDVRVIEQPNGGLSSARNTGLQSAKGEFIQFLDSDDLLTPGKIDLQLAQFKIQPKAEIAISSYLLCDESGTHFSRDGDPISRFAFSLEDFLFFWERGFSIPIHCGLFRRDTIKDIRFDTTVRGKEDWIFWCQQAHAKRRFAYAPVYGAIYRQHSNGMSKSFRAMGENWLVAAQRIRKTTKLENPRFNEEVAAWYRRFYLPRSADESRSARSAEIARAGNTAKDHTRTDTTWIDTLVSKPASQDPPLLSVLVPIYNHYDYLRECLTSIATQNTNFGYEIVLVDDCSSDPRIRPLLQSYAEKLQNVRLVLNKHNQGIAATQNAGVRAATGEFVAFVDCDDALEPNALATIERLISPNIDYLFTDRKDIDEKGGVLRISVYGGYSWLKPGGSVKDDLLNGMVASHLKVIRRTSYERIGGCDSIFTGIQDWDVALKIADKGGRFMHVPQPLYRHRLHSGSVTSSESVRQFWNSNVLRRQYSTRWLGRQVSDETALMQAARACVLMANSVKIDTSKVLVLEDFQIPNTLDVVRQAWSSGKICIYVPKSDSNIQTLNLAREYNSYLDAIFTDSEAMSCFFVGYMWDHRALHFIGEQSLSSASAFVEAYEGCCDPR